jgi:enoyl reductase
MIRVRNIAAIALTAGALALVLQPSPAYADWPPGGQTQFPSGPSGNASGSQISATAAGIRYDTSENGSGPTVGGLAPTTNWTPPPCWYAPTYTPQQFQKESETIWSEQSVGYEWVNTQRDRYVNGHPYKNFNLDRTGKGYWWTGIPNPDRIADPAALSCTAPTFWVDNGQSPPPIQNVISPQVLAGLAYAKVRVPNPAIDLSPAGKQTVNLNTWAWAGKATFKPVSVTASVPVLNISATTTATPIALHIDPGTQNATVYPASGDCPINADGSIGTPYTLADGNNIPPCGLTYLHTTTNSGPYQFKATIRWKINWTGTGNTGGTLPDGTFGTTTPLTVQEIQTVVR